MGTNELRKRELWQDRSGAKATSVERSFFHAFQQALQGTNFVIRDKPNEFGTIYIDYPLSPETLAEIYNPTTPIRKHGITPDYAIEHKESGKVLYVEIKRQDGWVEGKSRSAGRGNAHERSCKYFTPGLLRLLREKGKIPHDALPFWIVFQGDITRDPCRVREITCWFQDYSAHYCFWRNQHDPSQVIAHFDTQLKHLLY